MREILFRGKDVEGDIIKDYNCQVIGNIYDNPELMGGNTNG